MEIRSSDINSTITLNIIRRDLIYPSIEISVQVRNQDFCGMTTAWVFMEDLEAFLAQLKRCEETRSGISTLQSMSPEELKLVIEADDKLGHFGLKFNVGKYAYCNRKLVILQLTGGFALDSEFFARIVSDFVALKNDFL